MLTCNIANGSLDEEFGDPAKECSELPSSVHDPELEPADNTHSGMKHRIHTLHDSWSSFSFARILKLK